MTKTPDRFERIVRKEALGRGDNKFCYAGDVIKLLRAQHRAAVRMVHKIYPVPDVSAAYEDGFLDALGIILKKLNEREK